MSKCLQWFRLTISRTGKITDCQPVDDCGAAAGGVFYVKAVDAKAAHLAAGRGIDRDALKLELLRSIHRRILMCKSLGDARQLLAREIEELAGRVAA